MVDKIGRYLRLRRKPLLNPKDFFGRNQEEGDNIDQYVASLVRIDNRCAYVDVQTGCTRCGHAGDHSGRLKQRRIRDRLIFGLRDPGMQRRVLLEDFGQNLTVDRVLQRCKTHKSLTDTGLALAQESPAHLLASHRSAYKKAISELRPSHHVAIVDMAATNRLSARRANTFVDTAASRVILLLSVARRHGRCNKQP